MTKAVEKVKEVIKNNIEDALYGIFDCRNIVGDPIETIYDYVWKLPVDRVQKSNDGDVRV